MDKPPEKLLATIKRMRRRNARRWPEWLRRDVLAFAMRGRAERRTWCQIADDLGMSSQTVRRWCLLAAPVAAPVTLAPVEVVHLSRPAAEPVLTLSLTTPAGYRIDGLDVARVSALLRSLT